MLLITQNKQLSDVVGWTTTNDSLIIRNVSRFSDEVLPVYFKHHNFASFIRQANIYSFKKIRHGDGDNVYAHDKFIRGKPHLLKDIVRKLRYGKEDASAEGETSLPQRNEDRASKDILDLKVKQSNLY
jgi:heat shock transcription factor, other eukaryote